MCKIFDINVKNINFDLKVQNLMKRWEAYYIKEMY